MLQGNIGSRKAALHAQPYPPALSANAGDSAKRERTVRAAQAMQVLVLPQWEGHEAESLLGALRLSGCPQPMASLTSEMRPHSVLIKRWQLNGQRLLSRNGLLPSWP